MSVGRGGSCGGQAGGEAFGIYIIVELPRREEAGREGGRVGEAGGRVERV